MNDQKNFILAIVLSAMVLIAWQYFIGMPQIDKQRQQQTQQTQQTQQQQPPAQPVPGQEARPQPQTGTPPVPGQPAPAAGPQQSREVVIAASPRVQIETPRLKGSISLKGGRVDDLSLSQYHVTVDPNSPPVVLLSPSGSPHPFYAEFGWIGGAGAAAKLPDAETAWRQEGSGALGIDRPVTLTWDNGEGFAFRRTIAVDEKYVFTVRDEVANKGTSP